VDSPKSATVFVEVGYRDGDTFRTVGTETGFVVSTDGNVFTLDHASQNIPPGKIPVYMGRVGSKSASQHELYPVPSSAAVPGAQLLRFSPNLAVSWTYLKILLNHTFTTNDSVTAYGYPYVAQDIETRTGHVSNTLGPKGSVGVDMQLAPGMSGGPVTLGDSRCAVAVIAYGTELESYNYVLPVQLIKPLLDTVPVEYVTKFTISPGSSGPSQPELYDKAVSVDVTRADHGVSASEGDYSRFFQADPGAKIVSMHLVENSAAHVAARDIVVSPDGSSAKFILRLASGPIFDQWRGWWTGSVVITQQRAPAAPAQDECIPAP
jgi:hypothetical protein